MHRILAGLLFFLLLLAAGCSEPEENPVHTWERHASWSWQNCYPTLVDLHDVCAVDSLNLWIVGDQMSILHSTDGGITWTEQYGGAGTNYDFNTVRFVDGNTGWVVGSGIYHTTDGGANWDWQDNPSGDYLRGMAMVSRDLCYAYSWEGHVMKTVDGGANWRIIAQPSRYFNFNCMSFVNADEGWLGASDSIYHTTDGGFSWIGDSVGFGVGCCAFYDALHGWVGGSQAIAYTSDGGATWNTRRADPNSYFGFSRIIPRGPSEAWANSYALQHTVDGTTWTNVPLGANHYALGIGFFGSSRAWIVGYGGYIARSDDAGQSWATLSSQMWDALSAVDFVDDHTGWIVGSYGTVLHTTDEGAHWHKQATQDSSQYRAVDFVDHDFGWAVGNEGAILSTTDGGSNWNKYTTNLYDQLNAVAFADRFNGWAAGYMHYPNYGIYHTSDGGATWTMQSIPVSRDVNALSCTDALHAWAATDAVGVLRTTDGGNNWVLSRFPVAASITYGESEGVAFTDELHGCATLSNYNSNTPGLFRTIDGGVTWTSVMDSSQFTDICFADSLHGFAFGQSRYGGYGLWHTWDGGGHWYNFSSYTAAGMKFVKPQSGWLVGGGNQIRHYGY